MAVAPSTVFCGETSLAGQVEVVAQDCQAGPLGQLDPGSPQPRYIVFVSDL